jgi:hypothetical protein
MVDLNLVEPNKDLVLIYCIYIFTGPIAPSHWVANHPSPNPYLPGT